MENVQLQVVGENTAQGTFCDQCKFYLMGLTLIKPDFVSGFPFNPFTPKGFSIDE